MRTLEIGHPEIPVGSESGSSTLLLPVVIGLCLFGLVLAASLRQNEPKNAKTIQSR